MRWVVGLVLIVGAAQPCAADELCIFNSGNAPGIYYYEGDGAGTPSYPRPLVMSPGDYKVGTIGRVTGYWRGASGYYYPVYPALFQLETGKDLPGVIKLVDGKIVHEKPEMDIVRRDLGEFLMRAQVSGELKEFQCKILKARLDTMASEAVSGFCYDIASRVKP